jgi:hypothetical protein
VTLSKESFCEQMFQIAAAMDHSNQVNAILQRGVKEEDLLKAVGGGEPAHAL